MSPQTCQCLTPKIISDDTAGEILCKNCGIVLESHTTGHSDANEKNTTSRHDYGIGTAPAKIKFVHRSSRQISQRITAQEKKTRELFGEVGLILQKISAVAPIAGEAYGIARKCIRQHLTRGRRRADVAAACVTVACKVHGKAITESEIIKVANSSKKTTRKMSRIILEAFNLNIMTVHQRTIRLTNRICSDLGLSQRVATMSLRLMEKARKNGLVASSNPGTVAGAVVYLSCEKTISQRKIAVLSGVTDVSVRNFCKKLQTIPL